MNRRLVLLSLALFALAATPAVYWHLSPRRDASPKRVGAVVTYTGNHFSVFAKDAIFTELKSTHGGPSVLFVFDHYLARGDRLRIEADQTVSLAAGTSFLKVKRLSDAVTGYVPLETIVGETTLDGVETIPFGNSALYVTLARSPNALATLMETDYRQSLNAGLGSEVHPVTAANTALSVLLRAFESSCDENCRKSARAAGQRFFETYGFPIAKSIAAGVAWPYEFDWPMHWGITLKAPWYSGYANSVMALNAALMFKLTAEERYRDLCRKAIDWLLTSVDDGGALYVSDGREFLAEYAYASGTPAVRVYDGEMKSVISLYNISVILEDPKLLIRAFRLAENLASMLPMMQTPNGHIINARYTWLVDSPGYVSAMKLWASQLASISKDKKFIESSARWKQSRYSWE